MMAQVKGKDTSPEMNVRRLLHSMGYRFRLHRKDLPGNPDIVLPKHKKVIFVHGCFWHGHKGCPRSKRPSTNVEFWNNKLSGNIERDRKNLAALRKLGWKPYVIWECQAKDAVGLTRMIRKFFEKG
jgi:DNA mismatch endonuclease (patch repair protein)